MWSLELGHAIQYLRALLAIRRSVAGRAVCGQAMAESDGGERREVAATLVPFADVRGVGVVVPIRPLDPPAQELVALRLQRLPRAIPAACALHETNPGIGAEQKSRGERVWKRDRRGVPFRLQLRGLARRRRRRLPPGNCLGGSRSTRWRPAITRVASPHDEQPQDGQAHESAYRSLRSFQSAPESARRVCAPLYPRPASALATRTATSAMAANAMIPRTSRRVVWIRKSGHARRTVP